MKPGGLSGSVQHLALLCAALLLAPIQAVWAQDSRVTEQHQQSTLDGSKQGNGIRGWIEIAEPGNLGLLLMGIAGLLVGRWAARHKRQNPPDK